MSKQKLKLPQPNTIYIEVSYSPNSFTDKLIYAGEFKSQLESSLPLSSIRILNLDELYKIVLNSDEQLIYSMLGYIYNEVPEQYVIAKELSHRIILNQFTGSELRVAVVTLLESLSSWSTERALMLKTILKGRLVLTNGR